MQKRIIGIDVARALAIFGMIIVNFKMAFGNHGTPFLNTILGILDGKAAATFVVLAGVGISLMTKGALHRNNADELNRNKYKLLKRALFLFLIGISYSTIWQADILHFYGIYILLAIFLIKSNPKTLLSIAIGMIILYPILMILWDYDNGWDYIKMTYTNLWTVKGFFKNLFFNGFHPVIPWSAFMIIGMWFGKMELSNTTIVIKALWGSLTIFITVQILSYFSILFFSMGNQEMITELTPILGTDPMPPLPLYMISGSSLAIFLISSCILISKKYENTTFIHTLKSTGQLALTFYIAHVIIGMGVIELVSPIKMGEFTVDFSFLYALLFIIVCLIFSVISKKHTKYGPIEWIMRKLTD
ncbi:putative membrane protein YeiB [Aquimarina sp. MAR_2010_214]|uniref:DUF418 domain-containing protein n=1 Tax=Aquimarina sp. MAR_2010_214 TaxID=1250026 RepID=UPI000C70DE1A|nr:DUF418 domain-containing protein [Aquimarina sp. MAR_2010_214]PKV51668.1 putative membrane protein YeiB [Aquimarina sp. MAR_2010_214]